MRNTPPLSETYAYWLPSRLNDGSSSFLAVDNRLRIGEPSSGMSTRSKLITSDANATRRPSGDTSGQFSLPIVFVIGVRVSRAVSAVHKCIPVVAWSHIETMIRRESGSQSKD